MEASMLGLVYSTPPGRARQRLGKFICQGTVGVFTYDSPVVYRRLNAFGIAEAVLAEMLKCGYQQIHYRYESKTWWLTLDEALARGFRDFNRDGHLYVRLPDWHKTEDRQTYQWVTEGDTVELKWVSGSETVNARMDALRKAEKEAARPAAVQAQMMWG
jgi:hypothetical protein